MTPSSAIYHQIRWDDRFDAGRWTLGLEVRQPEPKRVALVDFVPGGDIPWHRVLYFEADGEVVWDRRTGHDGFQSARVGRRQASSPLPSPHWAPRPVLHWDGHRWTATDASGPPLAPEPRVLSWNVLFARFDDGCLRSAERRPLQADALLQAPADVIALQEVEWPLLARLLAAPALRDAFRVVLPGPPRDIDRHGLVLLCRSGVSAAGWLELGPHKGALAVVLPHWTGPLALAVTHLTSAHSTDASTRRSHELARIHAALAPVAAQRVVVGDFNDPGPLPATVLGLRDVGPAAPTFDPTTNALAALSSRSGLAVRIDRVLVGPSLDGIDAERRFVAPHPGLGLPLSDHYAVSVRLRAQRPSAAHHRVAPGEATPTTALAWLPALRHHPRLHAVRRAHDPAAGRWPPHVNLVYGCVPEHHFDAAVDVLAPALAALAPTPVRLSGTGRFDTRRGPLVWLDPTAASPEPWRALARTVDPLLPGCPRRRELQPHLTLGRPPASLPADTALPDRLDALHLLSRRGEGRMEVRVTLPLGGGRPRWHDPLGPAAPPTEAPDRTLRATALADQLRDALAPGIVHLVGSRALGVPLFDSDLDLVALVPAHLDASAAVRAALPPRARVRSVTGARVPGLQVALDELTADVALVHVVHAAHLSHGATGAVAHRHRYAPAAEHALSAVSDTAALQRALAPHGPTGRQLLQVVRAWTRARGLHARPFGSLPSVGWAVLVARSLADAPPTPDTPLSHLQARFFETWAEWDPTQPVALVPGWTPDRPRPMQVATPSAPVRACSDTVLASMAALISQELLRAWELSVDGAPLAELLAPPPLHRRHAAWARITVRDPRQLGRARGRLQALLDPLDAPGVHPWPWGWSDTGHAHFAVGLGPTPIDADALRQIAAPWLDRSPDLDLDVTWHLGAEVAPPCWPPDTPSTAAPRIG